MNSVTCFGINMKQIGKSTNIISNRVIDLHVSNGSLTSAIALSTHYSCAVENYGSDENNENVAYSLDSCTEVHLYI